MGMMAPYSKWGIGLKKKTPPSHPPPGPRARPHDQDTFGGKTECQGMPQSQWELGWASRLIA